jgi:hypothetical protein
MADATLRRLLGTPITVFTTGLNSHASGTYKQSSTVTPTSGEESYLFVWPLLRIASFPGTPSANAVYQGWFIKNINSYDEYGSASVAPVRPPDFQIDIPAVSGISNQSFTTTSPILLPRQTITFCLLYNGTGQTTASSGNSFILLPETLVADEA